jgi:hypothetical protein
MGTGDTLAAIQANISIHGLVEAGSQEQRINRKA